MKVLRRIKEERKGISDIRQDRQYVYTYNLTFRRVRDAFEILSQNLLGVTGKNDKSNLNQDSRTPDLNPSR
jgi:hypothetical protein